MECGRDLRKVDICVSVVEPETETETEPDPEPEPERNRNRNRNRNRKRNRKRNRNRNHNFFGGISPPHRRGEQKRFFLLKMTIISFFCEVGSVTGQGVMRIYVESSVKNLTFLRSKIKVAVKSK